jgi:hypothetical protein
MPTSGLCRPGAGSGWRGQESNPDVGIIRASCGCLKPYRPGAAALSSTLEHLSDQRERGPVPRSAAYCSRKQAARGDWIMPTRRALRTLVSCANVTGQVTVRHNPQVGIRHCDRRSPAPVHRDGRADRERAGRGLPGLRGSAGVRMHRPGALPAPVLDRRPGPVPGRGRARGHGVRDEAGPGPGDDHPRGHGRDAGPVGGR